MTWIVTYSKKAAKQYNNLPLIEVIYAGTHEKAPY